MILYEAKLSFEPTLCWQNTHLAKTKLRFYRLD